MSTFIKRSDGRQAAANGCHDDLVMASAIAHFISKEAISSLPPKNKETGFNHNPFSIPLQNDNYMEW